MKFVHIEDNRADVELIKATLRRRWPACRIGLVDTESGLRDELAREVPAAILSDFSLPRFDGMEALLVAKSIRPEVPFLFISGTIGEELAVEALRNGATDYVLKDRMARLIPAIERALGQTAEEKLRREAEQALDKSRELFRQITENVGDEIAVIDAQGKVVYANPVFRHLRGLAEDPVDHDFFAELDPREADTVRLTFAGTFQTAKGARCEYRLIGADGRNRYLEGHCSLLPGGPREEAKLVVVGHDVTERREAEARIREQASLLDRASDAICVTDMNLRIVYWNERAAHLFGCTAADAVGANLGEVLSTEEDARFDDAVESLRESGAWSGEWRPQTRDGRELAVESRCTLISNTKGEPTSALIMMTDVSERKRLEVQFLRAQRLESIGTLAGGIAHDLNNVLTPVLAGAQLLLSLTEARDQRLMLQTIEQSAQHGAALIKQVLLFARGAEGEHQPLNVRHLIAEMERFLRETLPRSIEIRARMDRDLAIVSGDSTQLKQVLMNLCLNARDAMPNGGRILIAARNQSLSPAPDGRPGAEATDHVLLTVEDTGTGIAPENLERIFDPFFTTKEIGKGTGLGLSTALGIVRSHGGWMNVTSELNKGTRFEIHLPAIRAAVRPITGDSRAPFPRGAGEGVLLVDDEPSVREVLPQVLGHCGYRAFVAANGPAALDVLKKNQSLISVALVDMVMPRMDGPATVRALKEISPELRVIVISGMLENDRLVAEKRLAGVELLRKPVTAEMLLQKLESVLKRPPGSAG